MPDLLDRASELEQRQRDVAIKKVLSREKETPDEDENGRYCLGCGNLIPVQRLHILPEAVRCVGCQQERE